MKGFHWKTPPIPKMVAHHNSDAEHSAIVLMGGYRQDGSVQPARDFFQAAIDETDFQISSPNLEAGFIELNEELHINIKSAIESPQWEWDRETKRQSGEVVGSPRNIVDSGELLNSQNWEIV